MHTTTLLSGQALPVVSDGFLDFFDDLEQAVSTAAALNMLATTAEELVVLCSAYASTAGAVDDTTVLALRRATDHRTQ